MAETTARLRRMLPNTANSNSLHARARSYSDARAGTSPVQRLSASPASLIGTPEFAKPIQRGTARPVLSLDELKAHESIAALVAARKSRRIGWTYYVTAFGSIAERFAPRCPCGRPLSSKPEIGRRVLSCACGFRCLEVA